MNSTHAVPPAARHPEPSDLALRLSYAGLLLFAVGALLVWLLVGRINDEPFTFVIRAMSSYGALIVSFLGGMRWGLVMGNSEAGALSPDYQRRSLWAGITFSLAAWLAMLMPPHAGLVVLGVLLIGCYLLDRKHYLELGVPGWLTLRFRLTAGGSLSCFLAAAQI
jgi:hypothetical protein